MNEALSPRDVGVRAGISGRSGVVLSHCDRGRALAVGGVVGAGWCARAHNLVGIDTFITCHPSIEQALNP
ncbi:hypothetical protein ACWGA9_44235 [Streptomyces sp. NPDC054950]